ncbi:MAG: hypothetical protein ACTSPY_15090 [Candidatus Helarchaeota archaeon]
MKKLGRYSSILGIIFIASIFIFSLIQITMYIPLNQNIYQSNPDNSDNFIPIPNPNIPLNNLADPPWWNDQYLFRKRINLTEPNVIPRNNAPISFFIIFDQSKPYNNSIRVASYNGGWTEIPSQVWNETFSGTFIDSATITIMDNLSQGETKEYYLYYDNHPRTHSDFDLGLEYGIENGDRYYAKAADYYWSFYDISDHLIHNLEINGIEWCTTPNSWRYTGDLLSDTTIQFTNTAWIEKGPIFATWEGTEITNAFKMRLTFYARNNFVLREIYFNGVESDGKVVIQSGYNIGGIGSSVDIDDSAMNSWNDVNTDTTYTFSSYDNGWGYSIIRFDDDALRMQGTYGSSGFNSFWYRDISTLGWTVASDDVLHYDIYVDTSNSVQVLGGVDIQTTTGNLRDSGSIDQNKLDAHPSGGLHGFNYYTSSNPPVSIQDADIWGNPGAWAYAYINNVQIPSGTVLVRAKFSCVITHGYSGDLQVRVGYSGKEVTIWNREGGSANDVIIPPEKSDDLVSWGFTESDFTTSRQWYLMARDEANGNTGTIQSFTMNITYKYPNVDLTGYADNQVYTRSISLKYIAGQTVTAMDIAIDDNPQTSGSMDVYYDNIWIERPSSSDIIVYQYGQPIADALTPPTSNDISGTSVTLVERASSQNQAAAIIGESAKTGSTHRTAWADWFYHGLSGNNEWVPLYYQWIPDGTQRIQSTQNLTHQIAQPVYISSTGSEEALQFSSNVGDSLDVIEYADYEPDSESLNLGNAGSPIQYSHAQVAPGWTAYHVENTIYDLSDQRNWQQNGGFTGSATGWTIKTHNEPGYASRVNAWYASNSIFCEIDTDDGDDMHDSEYASFQQNIYINRGEVLYAQIDYDFYVIDEAWNPGDIRVFVEINSSKSYYYHHVGFIFQDGSPEFGNWNHRSFTIPSSELSDVFNLPGTLSIRIGVECFTEAHPRGDNIYCNAQFDNVILNLRTKVKPTQVQLNMDDISVSNTGFGTGIGSKDLNINNPSSSQWKDIDFGYYTGNGSLVQMKVQSKLYIKKYSVTQKADGSRGTEFQEVANDKTVWTSYFYSLTPNNHHNHNFTIYYPSDWQMTDVYNPNPTDVTTSTINSTGILGVPENLVNDFSGLWQIKFKSYNYLDTIAVRNYSTGQIINDFRVGNRVLINTSITSSTFYYGTANLTIYYNSQLWWTDNATVNAVDGSINFNPFVLGPSNSSAGEYTVIVKWNNYTNNGRWPLQACEKRGSFNIIHYTSLERYSPTSQTLQLFSGETAVIKIRYLDTDISSGISGATATFTVKDWLGTGIDYSKSMVDSGNGVYTGDLSTLSHSGIYYVDVNVSKVYYDNKSSSNIFRFMIIVSTELTYDAVPAIPYGSNTTIKIYYINVSGLGVTNANINCNASVFDILGYNPSDNSYSIRINTSDTSQWPEGDYIIEVNASKSMHQNRTIFIPITIRPIQPIITYDAPSSVPWGQNTTFPVYYTINDPLHTNNGQGISNPDQILLSNTQYPSIEFTYIESAGGKYTLEINTTLWNIGTYIVNVTFVKQHYQTESVFVSVIIRSHNTEITYDPPQSIQWGDNATITIYYRDLDLGQMVPTDPAFITTNGSNANYNKLGTGIFEVQINSDSYSIGYHIINITVYNNQYINNSALVQIRIREHYTSLTYDAPEITPFWNNVTIYFYYKDIELTGSPGIDNSSGNVLLNAAVINPVVSPQPNMWIIDENNGKYKIIIETLNFPSVGIYTLGLNISWINTGLYQNQSGTQINFQVGQLNGVGRRTEVNYDTPQTVPYGDLLTLYLYYNDLDSLSLAGIRNDTGNVMITILIISHTIPSLIYTINDMNYQLDGKYNITIDTGSLLGNDTYQAQINFTWRKAAPFYENQSILLNFNVRLNSTYFYYDPPGSIPWSDTENATINLYYEDTDHGNIGIDGATLTATLLYPTNVSLIQGHNLSVYNPGNGLYIVSFNMENLTEGVYTFQFSINKSYHISRTLSGINLTIRERYTTLTSPDYPSIEVELGLYNISIYYKDIETGNNVVNNSPYVNITFFTYDSNKSLVNNAILFAVGSGINNYWIIQINTTGFNINLAYNLSVRATKEHYQSKEINITITLRKASTLIGITPPQSQVWGENSTFIIEYTDLQGNTIPNVQITMNWTQGSINYYSVNYSNNDGTYPVYINTTLGLAKTYILQVVCSAPNYQERTIFVNLPIRPIDSQITYDLPPLTPWGNNISFWIDYTDIFHSNPINGTNTKINININSSYWTWDYDNSQLGRYLILINSTYWNTTGTKYITLDIGWNGEPYYQNQTTQILVSLSKRSTDLTYTPPESVSFGENGSITVKYIDIDNNNQGIINTSSWGSNVRMELWLDNGSTSGEIDINDTLFGPMTGWSWIIDQGNGYYEFLINTSRLLNLGYYSFIIIANWSGKPYFDSATISTGITINLRNTEIIYDYPGYIGYGLNATIDLNYLDSISSNGIENTTGKLTITVIDSNSTIWGSNGYAWVNDLSNGNYEIILNTSKLQGIGQFGFTVLVNWSGNPYYANKSVPINIRTRYRNTELLYNAPPITPKNDLVNISIFFNDLDASVGIDNSTQNIWITANVTISNIYNMFIEQNGKYIIEIDTSDISLTIGVHIIMISVNSTGKPYYSNKTTYVGLSIRKIKTDLTYLEYNNNIPWNDTLSVIFKFNDTDHNYVGIPVSESNVSVNWANYDFTDNGNGVFTINFYTNVSLNTYSVWIFVNTSNIYEYKNISISFTVRKISTDYYTNVSFLSNWRWGENFTVEITYLDIDHSLNVSNLGLSNILVESGEPWNNGNNYSIIFTNNRYYLEFNTSSTYEGKIFYINISLSQTNYESQNFSIRITIRFPPLSVFATEILPGTTVAWGDNLTITVSVNDSETSLPIPNAYLWLENSTIWPSENYTIINQNNGTYIIQINTTWTGRNEDTYQLSIYASAQNYHNSSAKIIITIKKASTELLIIQAPTQIQFADIGNITLWYNCSEIGREGGLPNSLINIYYSNSTGLYEWNGTQINGSYQVISLGNGKYRLLLNTSSSLNIGQFTLIINASLSDSWGIWKDHYEIGQTQYILTVINRKTSFITTQIPSGSIPWNSTFIVGVEYNDSTLFVGLEDAIISVNGWVNYSSVSALGNGKYQITFNSSYINPENFSTSISIIINANKTNYEYKQLIVYVIIRPILTQVSYSPPNIIPKNNTALFTITYKDLDNDKFITNSTSQVMITSNISSWNPSASIVVNELGNGNYNISIDTSYLPYSDMIYNIQFNITWNGIPYYANKSFILNLEIRSITTILYIDSIPPSPVDDNITLTAHYYVSDSESIFNTLPIDSAQILLPNTFLPYSVIDQGNGIYLIEIDKSAIPNVQTYNLWIYANRTHFTPSNTSFSFDVRSRQTIITYDIPDQVSFGDNVSISTYLLDVDAGNLFITNSSGNINFKVYNSTMNEITNVFAWISNLSNKYLITINTSRLNYLGSHNFTVVFNYIGGDLRYDNTTKNIYITVIARNSELTYTAPETVYYGANSTFNLSYIDLDAGGIGISNNTYKIQFDVIIDSNQSFTQIWVSELEPGVFKVMINTSKITSNMIGFHTIQINVSYFGKPYYNNRSTTITFATRKMYTDHVVYIGDKKTESYTGWHWGRNISIIIYYNNTDTNENIADSNLIITGDSPYNVSSTRPVINYNNGTFYIQLNGTVPDHGITYHLNIILYKDETVLNQSFTVSISFIKNLTNIFFKSIDYSVPWNDNATLIFSYNDTEATGNPGIPNANITITVDKSAAIGYFTDPPIENISLGPGVYVIILNTSWAPNNLTLIKFTIHAERFDVLPITTSITIQIRPISCELNLIDRNYTVWKDGTIQHFNVSLSLIDIDHNNNPIVNNSQSSYSNISFFVKYNNILHRGTWEYGNYTVFDIGGGIYIFKFTWQYDTPELLEYGLKFHVNGSHLDLTSLTVIFNLKIHFHTTNITLDWNYIHNVLNKTYVPYFEPYQPNHYYGDEVNITFYWYDLNATNNGISLAIIRCNWSANYYRLISLYQITRNESYKGLYTLRLETGLYKNMIGDYTIFFNATYSMLEIEYIVSNKTVNLTINSVPTALSLLHPIISTPYGDFIKVSLNYSNLHTMGGISRPDQIIISNATTSQVISSSFYYVEYLGGVNYNISLESTIWAIGSHNISIEIRKQNYDTIIRNFTITVRKIFTEIRGLNVNFDVMYRTIQIIQFQYYDLDHNEYIKVGGVQINSNWSGVFNIIGFDASGNARIDLNASLSVGVYSVQFTIEAPNYELASSISTVNITQATTNFELVINPQIEIYQGTSITFSIQFNNTFGEVIEGATISYIIIRQSDNTPVSSGYFTEYPNGVYVASINTWGFWIPGYYDIIITATPANTNYSSYTHELETPVYVNSMFQHPIAIIAYIIIGAIGSALLYKQIRWWLLPEVLKKIIKSTKLIKKGRVQAKPPVVRSRQEMFSDEFTRHWNLLGLEIKGIRVVSPEILAFASEISAVLRSRLTSTEAEQMINYLKSLPSQVEAENYLQSIGVPPGATRRLLEIIGIIQKEKVEILDFAKALSEIKGTPLDYAQAEEVMKALLASPSDADNYLKAMIIPEEDRARLLEMIGISKKKIKKKKEKQIKPSKKGKKPPQTQPDTSQDLSSKPKKPPGLPSEQPPMTDLEIEMALNEIPGLSPEDIKTIIDELKKLSYEEQQKFIDELKKV